MGWNNAPSPWSLWTLYWDNATIVKSLVSPILASSSTSKLSFLSHTKWNLPWHHHHTYIFCCKGHSMELFIFLLPMKVHSWNLLQLSASLDRLICFIILYLFTDCHDRTALVENFQGLCGVLGSTYDQSKPFTSHSGISICPNLILQVATTNSHCWTW